MTVESTSPAASTGPQARTAVQYGCRGMSHPRVHGTGSESTLWDSSRLKISPGIRRSSAHIWCGSVATRMCPRPRHCRRKSGRDVGSSHGGVRLVWVRGGSSKIGSVKGGYFGSAEDKRISVLALNTHHGMRTGGAKTSGRGRMVVGSVLREGASRSLSRAHGGGRLGGFRISARRFCWILDGRFCV